MHLVRLWKMQTPWKLRGPQWTSAKCSNYTIGFCWANAQALTVRRVGSEGSQYIYCFSSYIWNLKINLDLQSQGDKGKRMAIITQLLHPPSRLSQAQARTWCLTWIMVASLHSPSSSASLDSLKHLANLCSCFTKPQRTKSLDSQWHGGRKATFQMC